MNKILIAGFGSIGAKHMAIAKKRFPDSVICLLRRSNQFDVPEMADLSVNSIEEAVAFAPDISVICSPASHHISQSVALVRGGSHVLIEKPLADSLEHLHILEEATRLSGKTVMVGYNLRFSHSLQYFKKMIEEGAHGKTLSVRAEVGHHLASWRPNQDYRQGVSAIKTLGGGVLLELSHEIDYLQWLFGPCDWINAHVGKFSDLEIDVEDSAYLLMGKGDPQLADSPVIMLTLDFIRQDKTRKCTLIGDHKTLIWDGIAGSVSQYPGKNGEWEVLFEKSGDIANSYEREWDSFLHSITVQQQPDISLYDGRLTLEVIDAARKITNLSNPVHRAI